MNRYGMKLREAAPGAQPRGFIEIQEDPTGKYYSILLYDRKLTEDEVNAYDLEEIKEA